MRTSMNNNLNIYLRLIKTTVMLLSLAKYTTLCSLGLTHFEVDVVLGIENLIKIY